MAGVITPNLVKYIFYVFHVKNTLDGIRKQIPGNQKFFTNGDKVST